MLAERRGAVLVLTLNRPERLNAWTDALEDRYYARLDAAENDPEVRAIVVTGAGRGFCAGADMSDLERGATGDGAEPSCATVRGRGLPADRAQADDRRDQRRGRRPGARRGAVLRRALRHAARPSSRPRSRAAGWSPSTASRGCCRGWSGPARRWTCCSPAASCAARRRCGCGSSTASASPSALVDDAVAYAAGTGRALLAVVDGHDQGPGPGRPRAPFAAAVAAADELMLCSFDRPDVAGGRAQLPRARAPAFPSLDPGRSSHELRPDRPRQGLPRARHRVHGRVRLPRRAVYEAQMRESGDPHFHPPILEELKAEARARGLWNLFHPHPEWGPGLTNAEYAPLAEIMGRSPHLAPEAMNCSAPDTGNMEVLTLFGTEEHKERWLRPLLDGEIRSAFAMTEPAVASRDATNIETRIERDGDEYVINGRKWWTSNALHTQLQGADRHGQDRSGRPRRTASSRCSSSRSTRPGVTIVRGLPVFGYQDREGHAEVLLRGRARAGERAAGRRGRRLHDLPGAARARAHPPLHALDRHGRARARPALPAGAGAHDLRQAGRRERQHPGLDRRVADRAGDGPAAHA